MAKHVRIYRNRPTKWYYLEQYFELNRSGWKLLRAKMKEMLLEGRLGIPEYLFTYNLEQLEEYRWIQERVNRAYAKTDPIRAINQINIYKLEECVEAINVKFKEIATSIEAIERLPLEETFGFQYNQEFHMDREDREAFLSNEVGFVQEDNALDGTEL